MPSRVRKLCTWSAGALRGLDRRVVVNPRQARELLTAVTYVGQQRRGPHARGQRLMALYACMYFAALRPGEAVALRWQDCYLPATGWGRLTLEKSRPEVNRRWTDTASAHEERGLKHRPASETRRVPIPPELVAILRQHIDTFDIAADGRIFSSDRGHPVASTAISDVWAAARNLALTPAQAASSLAGRPYDLRHAAVSLWLSARVPPPRVAERAGHSVEVLLRVYAKCPDVEQGPVRPHLRGGQQHQEAGKRDEQADDTSADAPPARLPGSLLPAAGSVALSLVRDGICRSGSVFAAEARHRRA